MLSRILHLCYFERGAARSSAGAAAGLSSPCPAPAPCPCTSCLHLEGGHGPGAGHLNLVLLLPGLMLPHTTCSLLCTIYILKSVQHHVRVMCALN